MTTYLNSDKLQNLILLCTIERDKTILPYSNSQDSLLKHILIFENVHIICFIFLENITSISHI